MAESELTSRITRGRQAVRAQTELLHREFGRVQSQWKADGTRVTAVDIAISENIARALKGEFDDDYFSEELAIGGGPVPATKRFAWVLDPIDGTNNYATGIAQCAISLALLDDGQPVYGFVYDMARRTLIEGGRDFGVIDGGQPARVKDTPPEPQSLVGFHTPFDRAFANHAEVLAQNFKIRALGSSTLHLAYVAIGILDGVVDHNVKIWDIAAAVALVQGAGGELSFLNGDPFPLRVFDLNMKRIFYTAGNAAMNARLRELVSAA